MSADAAARLCSGEIQNDHGDTAQHGDRQEIVEGAPRVEHGNELPARLEHAGDFALGGFYIRDVVQNAMRKDEIEAVIRERKLQGAGAFETLVGKPSQTQPRRNTGHTLRRQINAGPQGTPPDYLLALRT